MKEKLSKVYSFIAERDLLFWLSIGVLIIIAGLLLSNVMTKDIIKTIIISVISIICASKILEMFNKKENYYE